MPLDQHIEDGHGADEARLKIGPAPVHDLFEMADQRQHGEDRLDEHAVLPLPARTELEVGGVALGGMETGITQDHHPPINLLNQPALHQKSGQYADPSVNKTFLVSF